MGSFLKFRLLLWKNFLIQKRKPIATIFELGLPTLFSLILMVLRLRVVSIPHNNVTHWRPCEYKYLEPYLLTLKLAYTPDNEVTERVIGRLNKSLGIQTVPFNTESDLVKAATTVNKSSHHAVSGSDYLGGVVFEDAFHKVNGSHMFKKQVSYKIRLSYAPRKTDDGSGFKSDTSWSTRFAFPTYQIVGPRESLSVCNWNPGYRREGFLAIQNAVDASIFQEVLSEESFQQFRKTTIYLQRHPYPPYKKDNYVLVLQQQFPLVIMLSLVVVVLGIVRDIVLEKERRLKETMKMMGINNWLHWTAWFTRHFLFLLISVSVMTLFFCVKLDPVKGGVVDQTNPFIIFLYLMCYSVASITFCFAVSVFFAKANSGAAIGGIMFFCMYIPYFFLQRRYTTMTLGYKLAACFDFQVAMSFGGTLLGMFEGVGSGIQLSNISGGVSVDDDFSMMLVLIMLLVDSVLHCLIAWYIEAVFPGEYGFPQRWYFPVSPRYWNCSRQMQDYGVLDEAVHLLDATMFEKDPNETAGIQIRNLRKVYGKGASKTVAVCGMTLNMYEGQITALLGHNGAGKTTTMSMLTGFYPPTSGTAIINGYDICQDIGSVRSVLGLCPQHDILFDNLTVEEHMVFFSLLKGVPKREVISQCEELLKDMELFPKLKAKAKTLSGGMKRKLSVCIALVGNSKVVFLDEPSSGLDPNARRNIWTVLQKNRAGRTMVLSTHFMDEADLLGDRIAIMADGVIKCCGSSLFLKKKFGAGYHMVIVKNSTCKFDQVVEVVKSHIEQAEVESNVGAELSFILPQECVGSFEALFLELEKRQVELGIGSFGASVTTMEEVFLKVKESQDLNLSRRLKKSKIINYSPDVPKTPSTTSSHVQNGEESNFEVNNTVREQEILTSTSDYAASSATPIALDLAESLIWSHCTLDFSKRFQKNTGSRLFMQQFFAMFMKRMLHTYRNKLITATQLIIPLFFTVMGIVVLKTLPSFIDAPPLKLTVNEFGKNYVPYASGITPGPDMAHFYANQFQKGYQVQTMDVNKEPGFRNDPNISKYLAMKGEEGIGIYNLRYMVAGNFNKTNERHYATVTAYFNNQAYHSIAISFAMMINGLLHYFTNSTEYGIETTNHPLPRLTADKLDAFPITNLPSNMDLKTVLKHADLPLFHKNHHHHLSCDTAVSLISGIRDQENFKDPTGFTLGFNVAFGMAFLASSFVIFLVKERDVKAKHIQFVSGVHPITFWLSTVCWDLINFIFPCLVLILAFVIFSIDQLTDDMHWLQIFLLFLLYGWAMLPYMYFFSFAFSVPSTAYVWITMFNILTGVATMLVVVILSIPQIDLQDVSEILEWMFMALFPNFCLSQGIFEFYENSEIMHICKPIVDNNLCPFIKALNKTNACCPGMCGELCLKFNENYLGWEKDGIGRMLTFLTLQGCVLWLFIFAFEYGWPQKLRYALFPARKRLIQPGIYSTQLSNSSVVQEDEDVARERSRIDNTEKNDLFCSDKLILDNLTKYYGHFRAVDHLSVGIPSGECFGLLGINGAGKTSTFMMLTGDSIISSGEAFLNRFNLKFESEQARKHLGYCPQSDALIGQLTGHETLTLFARLRGIKESLIAAAVNDMMDAFHLHQYADVQCQKYSGGNKRKLSTAIALIGDPDVIYLDEPTTGMDPVARRMLWEVLTVVRDSGRTLVLTSHSMEECEALCTRLAIMVNGQFKCLGSIQHLKNKFGEGYTFSAKVAFPEDGSTLDLTPLREFMDSTFPNNRLTDIHENMVNYHIKDVTLSWAEIFGQMERAKERLCIEDYLVSQTSLEQVFLYFARMQDAPDMISRSGSKDGCNCSCCFPCMGRCNAHNESIAYTNLDHENPVV